MMGLFGKQCCIGGNTLSVFFVTSLLMISFFFFLSLSSLKGNWFFSFFCFSTTIIQKMVHRRLFMCIPQCCCFEHYLPSNCKFIHHLFAYTRDGSGQNSTRGCFSKPDPSNFLDDPSQPVVMFS